MPHTPKPLRPIEYGHKSYRHFRTNEGFLEQRPVIMHKKDGPVYVIEKVLSESITIYGMIMIAIPSRPEHGFLVPCAEPVIIKARKKNRTNHNPLHEVGALQLLAEHRHNNIVHIIDCIQDDTYVYIVLPFYKEGDVLTPFEKHPEQGMDEAIVRNYLEQIVSALLHMKTTCHLVHHDLSLENIVFCSNKEQVVLIDLELSIIVPRHEVKSLVEDNHFSGKPGYISPEIARMDKFCDLYAIDVWSLGICVYSMIMGIPLYEQPYDPIFRLLEEGNLINIIRDDEYTTQKKMSSEAVSLLVQMLEPDTKKRITLERISEHPFLVPPEKRQISNNSPPLSPLSPCSSIKQKPSCWSFCNIFKLRGPWNTHGTHRPSTDVQINNDEKC